MKLLSQSGSLSHGICCIMLLSGLASGLTSDGSSGNSQKTLQNIQTAMKGEALAYAKYRLFSQHARSTGHHELAELFEDTAQMELDEHFKELSELAGTVRSNVQNLRDAISGESYEASTMYLKFAAEARAAGDVKAAERFEEIAGDEAAHRDAFSEALRNLEGKTKNQ